MFSVVRERVAHKLGFYNLLVKINLQINGSFWLLIMNGGYIFKLLFHPQNKCCCHSFLEYSCLCLCFRSLVKTKVKEEMRKEIQLNQKVQHLTQAH